MILFFRITKLTEKTTLICPCHFWKHCSSIVQLTSCRALYGTEKPSPPPFPPSEIGFLFFLLTNIIGFDSRPRHLNFQRIFRDWLSPASKSRYGWKIAKSTLILKTTKQQPTTFNKLSFIIILLARCINFRRSGVASSTNNVSTFSFRKGKGVLSSWLTSREVKGLRKQKKKKKTQQQQQQQNPKNLSHLPTLPHKMISSSFF